MPATLSLVVLVTAGFSVEPIRDAATLADVAEAYLTRPLGYIAIAPVSNVFDTLALLSARQHLAVLAGVGALFALWRVLVHAAGWRRHAVASAVLVGVVLLVYTAAAFLPRPMAALGSDNANILKIDFHSHTTASHDGFQSVEALREWHRRAGYDVAYISDHATVAAAERGMAGNPVPVGTGVTLLQSIETNWAGEHVSIPGVGRVYKGLLTADLAAVDTLGLHLVSLVKGREPIVIWNHPRNLDALPPATADGIGVRAIEIVNGSPRDMDRVRAARERIVTMAQGGGVALVSGSDNHGFGRATPGWTLMLIVGWRGATPDDLAREIDRVIRTGGFNATRVVERRVADPGGSRPWLAASVATVPLRMFTTLSNDERGSWLVWIWLTTLVVRTRRRLRAPSA